MLVKIVLIESSKWDVCWCVPYLGLDLASVSLLDE